MQEQTDNDVFTYSEFSFIFSIFLNTRLLPEGGAVDQVETGDYQQVYS